MKSKKHKDIEDAIARNFTTTIGPDGEEILHRPMDELGALSAVIEGIDGEEGDHFLLPAMRAQPEGVGGIADIIACIDRSKAMWAEEDAAAKEAPLADIAEEALDEDLDEA